MRGLLTMLSVVGLLVVALAFPACGHVSAADVAREIAQGAAFAVSECGPTAAADYHEAQARAALHAGGPDWLSIVLGAGPCVARVVADERAAHAKAPEPCASADAAGCVEAAAAPEAPGEEMRMRQVLAVQELAARIQLPPTKVLK